MLTWHRAASIFCILPFGGKNHEFGGKILLIWRNNHKLGEKTRKTRGVTVKITIDGSMV